ncbi:FAD-binding oxidoreductase [Halocatena salina]|uniref:FAD-binding oxidoreductase n=1 Tax=Halocatena salina TaxID=2934340 RepID=A0A8U0A3Y7_9EURY|nr:FAD-binding oxidoreductase [Halocatena salina]UPM43566.1 FAD-binding oxidoreductase [Halocatena salina]
MNATHVPVVSVRTVGSDAVALELRSPEGFDARPGQFVKLSATVDDEEVSRFYTISSPHITETFETTLTIDPTGTFGPYLSALESGDTIGVAGPFGNAYYEDEAQTLIVAGGPGVGPAVGIAERTVADGGETAVVYVDEDPIHEKRLSALSEQGATVFVVSEGDALPAAIENATAGAEPQPFVYGFADFLELATDALGAVGVDTDAAKTESFGPAPDA